MAQKTTIVTAQELLELGIRAQDQAHFAKAVEYFTKLLEHQPNNFTLLNRLSVAYGQMGDYDSAIGILEKLREKAPDDEAISNNLVRAYLFKGSNTAAQSIILKQLESNPKNYTANDNLIASYDNSHQADKALEHALKARKILPKYNRFHVLAANLYKRVGEVEKGFKLVQTIKKKFPNDQFSASYSNYVPDLSPKDIFKYHRNWAQTVEKIVEGKSTPLTYPPFESGQKIKIAYLSPDLRNHSVAYFIRPILQHHDRSKFEITLIYTNDGTDEVTQELFALADHAIFCMYKSSEEICKIVRDRQIHVLIDLAGATGDQAHPRLETIAMRAAPLQGNWIGYPNTTALENMDIRISDHLSDPPGITNQWHTEELIYMDGGFSRYSPPLNYPNIPTKEPPFPLSNRPFMFGSYNQSGKIHRRLLKIWGQILEAVPQSGLFFKGQGIELSTFQDVVKEELAHYNVAPERLVFTGLYASRDQHLQAMYLRSDLALDPFPYSGTTTTCETLWMGTPVLSLFGQAHVNRVSAAMLAYMGLPQFTAVNEQDYIDKAIYFANNPNKLIHGEALRNRFASSSLMEYVKFTRELEQKLANKLAEKYKENETSR